jgi:protoheme IX farnesyltransferase
LAILYRDDYTRADVPMLPTMVTPKQGAWWVMSHTVPTALGAVLLAVTPALGWFYFLPVLIVSLDLVRRNVTLIQAPTPKNARAFFMSSNYYLTVLLLAICISTVVGNVVSWL